MITESNLAAIKSPNTELENIKNGTISHENKGLQ